MGCDCSTDEVTVEPTAVFTSRSTAWNAIVLMAPQESANTARLMIRWRLDQVSDGDAFEAQLFYQHSNDLFSWTEVDIGSVNDETVFLNATVTLSTDLFYQVGVKVRNKSGQTTYVESANVEMFITPSAF